MTRCAPSPAQFQRQGLRRAAARGLSVVELMVGITIGLFILAAATMLTTTQLGDNRRLLLEAQVQQDLRVTTDLIARELRRAAYWGKAGYSVWPGSAGAVSLNPYVAISPAGTASAVKVEFRRSRDEEGNSVVSSELNDPDAGQNKAGFWFDPDTGILKTLMGDGTWQALNDPQVMRITSFEVDMQTTDADAPCGASCPTGPAGCPLVQTMRNAVVRIVSQSAVDANVRRSVTYSVKLRNDIVREKAAC